MFSAAIMGVALYINSGHVMEMFKIVENNKYNTIAVYVDEDGGRHLSLNNNDSSMYDDEGNKHEYIEFIERMTINNIPDGSGKIDILVLGAGAFTYGHNDEINNYDYVDIDASLQNIAERYILKEKLKPNKVFHPVPARAFLTSAKKKYDVILLDAYFGDRTIPEHLVTKEFFDAVKAKLEPGGIVVANFIISPNFQSRFSQKIDNTLRAVFPYISRMAINEEYNLWSNDYAMTANMIYLYKDQPGANPEGLYTDNKNTIFYDKPQRR